MKCARTSATISQVWCAIAVLVLGWPCFARADWVTLQNGRYLAKRYNDGDSFHVSVSGKEYIFRLYFVDAPETSTEFRDRIEEQAKYLGITVEQAVKVGELAKAFTRERLGQPFLVRTCWQDAMGRSRMQRFYAIVQTSNGDLGEQLIENGLARVHGAQASPEGITSARREWQRLTRLERKARQERVGGWGVEEGRITARAGNPESATGVDPFDTFSHPEKVVAANAPQARSPATPEAAIVPATPSPPDSNAVAVDAKLDINTASEAELENIPGVGPVLAQRIVDARPFRNADDLRTVKGIGGGKKYEKIRPYFN